MAANAGAPQGSFILTILAAVVELERATIRERQDEGISIAKAAGKYERVPKLSAGQIDEARQRTREPLRPRQPRPGEQR